MTVEEYAAAGFEAPQQDSFSIYQLRNEDSTRDYRFEPYDRLLAAGLTVDKANYTEVYAAPLTAGTTLEDIYRTFNVDHPADFKGHSLSVSDVVVLHQNGQDTAHYCDSVGFQQVPEFLRENPLRTAELSTEQNENMIDGVLNNAPSLGELEAKAKAGEQISLTDLAAAVNLYELDYQQHFQHIRDAALPVGANRLIYESGMREIGPKEHFDSRPDKYFGEFVRHEMQPRDPELLQAAIRQEQRSRESAQPGDFKEHLAALHTGLIEAEAQRIVAGMKRLAAPNSPDKNHFMVEVSPYFTNLASSRDTDQLLAMLPYKSLHLSSVKDRFGIYALIDKNENRDKGICKPRTSVRKQLSETKQAASPKKAAARSKQHEMEV